MAKRNRGRKKQPRQSFDPKRDRVPRESPANTDIQTSKFCWRFRAGEFDWDGEWGWANVDLQCLFHEVLPKLHGYETMTWAEIETGQSGCHFVSVEACCSEARRRLCNLNMEDVEELFSLRIAGKQRVWGRRDVTQLLVLWWDPEHEVCPSPKRST